MNEFKKFKKVEEVSKAEEVSVKDYTKCLTELRSCLTSTLLQTQTWHFQTKNPIIHSDLGEFYGSLIGYIDTIVETIQGRYSVITGDLMLKEFTTFNVDYYKEFQESLESYRLEFCTNVQNQIDEILDITNKLMYKLSLNNFTNA